MNDFRVPIIMIVVAIVFIVFGIFYMRDAQSANLIQTIQLDPIPYVAPNPDSTVTVRYEIDTTKLDEFERAIQAAQPKRFGPREIDSIVQCAYKKLTWEERMAIECKVLAEWTQTHSSKRLN